MSDRETAEPGGYRMIRRLGRHVHLGGRPDGRTAAVRVPADPGQGFARAVEAAAKVSSFCTAQVLDADPGARRPWVATEYVEGPTLAATVGREGPRAGGELQRLAIGIATGLAAVHAAGTVHGGLTPERIVLAGDGPRVVGFPGTARPGALPADDVRAWAAAVVFAATGVRVGRDEEGASAGDGAPDAADGAGAGTRGEGARSGESGETVRLGGAGTDLAALVGRLPGPLREPVRSCLVDEPGARPTADGLLASLVGYAGGAVPGPSAVDGALVFADEEFTDRLDLAEAFQMNWAQATGLLFSPVHRQALRRWLWREHPIAAGVVDRAPSGPTDADLRVARLIALLGPELTPCFRRHDMALARIAVPGGALVPRVFADPDLVAALEAGLLSEFALHHCADPVRHGCRAGHPCRVYAEFAEAIEPLLAAVGDHRVWARAVAEAIGGRSPIREFAVDYTVLTEQWLRHRDRPLDEVLAEWEGLGEDARGFVRAAAAAAPEGAAATVAVVAAQAAGFWADARERSERMPAALARERAAALHRRFKEIGREMAKLHEQQWPWAVTAAGVFFFVISRFVGEGGGGLFLILSVLLMAGGLLVFLGRRGDITELRSDQEQVDRDLRRERAHRDSPTGRLEQERYDRVVRLLEGSPLAVGAGPAEGAAAVPGGRGSRW